jgi:hypothetical protein
VASYTVRGLQNFLFLSRHRFWLWRSAKASFAHTCALPFPMLSNQGLLLDAITSRKQLNRDVDASKLQHLANILCNLRHLTKNLDLRLKEEEVCLMAFVCLCLDCICALIRQASDLPPSLVYPGLLCCSLSFPLFLLSPPVSLSKPDILGRPREPQQECSPFATSS